MERAIHFQLINIFEENNYLHPRQHGFRKSYSTLTAIQRMLRNMYDAYDLGPSTSCAFVYTSDHDPELACKTNEQIINKIYNWCNENKFTINFRKTKHMMFFRNKQLQNSDNLNIEIENEHIENVISFHNLDIDLDNGL